MIRNSPFILLALCLAALLSPACVAQVARAAGLTPDEVLKTKGLTKTNSLYLLDADANLPGSLRTIRQLKIKVDDASRRRVNLQKDIDSACVPLDALVEKYDQLTDKLNHTSKSAYASYNVIVDQVNAVRTQILEGIAFVEKRQETMASIDDPSDQYVTLVLQYVDMMEAIESKYEQLAADKDVISAIDQINASATPTTKVTLGPSARFKQELPDAEKLRDTVNSATFKFDMAGGVPNLPVIINGQPEINMVVDSGAAMVTLTSDTADKLGLHPGPEDREVKLHAADGKDITAHIMRLKSVRLGQFTVQNIFCAIQPPEVKDAMDLLGGTFLEHFVYKMDLGAGVLHVSEVTPKVSGDATPAALPKPLSTTPPTPTQIKQGVVTASDWTALFRSSDPSIWDTQVNDGENSFAMPLSSAPDGVRFLRIAVSETDYVIVHMTNAALGADVLGGGSKIGWNGDKRFDCRAYHLGVTDTSLPKRRGSVDIGKAGGIAGWGFGNHRNVDDAQACSWDGQEIQRTVFEISVKTTPLTEAETQHLLE